MSWDYTPVCFFDMIINLITFKIEWEKVKKKKRQVLLTAKQVIKLHSKAKVWSLWQVVLDCRLERDPDPPWSPSDRTGEGQCGSGLASCSSRRSSCVDPGPEPPPGSGAAAGDDWSSRPMKSGSPQRCDEGGGAGGEGP